MKYPHIQSVIPKENFNLFIVFDNDEKRLYDTSRLFDKEMFAPLKNKKIFREVKIEKGGYAISWDNDIDISEYELWKNGEKL